MKGIGKFVGRIIWNFSESFYIPLGKFAPIVFGWMIGAKGILVKTSDGEHLT